MNNRVFVYIYFCLAAFLFVLTPPSAFAQDAASRYSIFFGWKTEGSPELLARKAAAFSQLKDTRSLAFSFGALLGPTLLVRHDTADQYLRAAYSAGLDYIIPAAPEFMFGVEALKHFADTDGYPRFISANIVDEKTRRPLMDPYATWYVSGLRICVIALSDTAIIKQSKDDNIRGVDILSYDEALNAISIGVARENADIVMAAGRMDRAAIQDMVKKHPFIDGFITNNQSGGFSGPKGTTSIAFISGKPVYIGPEASNQLGHLSVSGRGGSESRDFTTITLGDAFPPDANILAGLNRTIEEIKKRDLEESVVVKTGGVVTSTLRNIYKADAVFLERQSLFYFPLADSLTIFNVRNIIKPFEKLTLYELKGSALKSILADNDARRSPDLRLLIAGMTADGKLDSIPVADDTLYTVLTTTHLRSGGNGYGQFRTGTGERLNNVNMLAAVEAFLIEKDERIRVASRPKYWSLLLTSSLGVNFNKIQVDMDKKAYGGKIPAPFKDLKDQFLGLLNFTSNGNKFSYKKRRHTFETVLNTSYTRTGTRTETGKVIYANSNDAIRLQNKYSYNKPTFFLVPFVEVDLITQFYAPSGKHPIRAELNSGFGRKIPKLWLDANLSLNGTRNYVNNMNTLGAKGEFIVSKTIPPRAFLTTQTSFSSKIRVYWSPTAQAHHMFRHENENAIDFQLWKKFGLKIIVNTYSYRDNTRNRTATGLLYYMSLGYNVQWKH